MLLSFIRLYCFIKIVLSCFFLVQLGITEVGRILNGLYCFSAAGKKKEIPIVSWSLSVDRYRDRESSVPVLVASCPVETRTDDEPFIVADQKSKRRKKKTIDVEGFHVYRLIGG